MVRPTLIDMNSVDLKYYPFVISIDKCTGSCNALSQKICVPKETKDIYVKAFNMITNKNEAEPMTKHIPCYFKSNSIVPHVIQIENGIIKHVNANVKLS